MGTSCGYIDAMRGARMGRKGGDRVLCPCQLSLRCWLSLFGVKKPVKVVADDKEEPGNALHQCWEEEAG